MADQKINLHQEFVDRVTNPAHPDIPGGTIGPNDAPMPTEAEKAETLTHIEKWKAAYVARFVEVGMPEDLAIADYEGGCPDHDYMQDPIATADEVLSYWGDDGDQA